MIASGSRRSFSIKVKYPMMRRLPLSKREGVMSDEWPGDPEKEVTKTKERLDH